MGDVAVSSLFRLKDKLFYGWVVVLTFVIVGTAIWGIRFTFGVFFKSIESEFDLTRAATSTIFSTQMVLGGIFTILGGWALDRYGPKIVFLLLGLITGLGLLLTSQTNALWQLFFTYSLLLAMGTSAIYVGVMSTVSRWFDRKRGLAMGIASSGAGLGPLLIAPFATYLITNLDWRTAYLVIGVIAWLVVIPLSRLLKRDPYEIGLLPDGVKILSKDRKSEEISIQPACLSLPQAVKTRSFWLVIFIFFLFAVSLFLILTHLVPHATDIGFSTVEAATVLSLTGGATLAGRVLLGSASDRIGRKAAAIICTLLHAGAMLWLLWSQELWMLYMFAIVFGLAWGGMGPTMAALIGDTFGLGKIGAILGVLDAGFNVGAAIGPVMGGLIFDVSHSYFLAFLLGAAVMLMATLLIALIRQETNRNFAGR
jgi:OFA family oxalate/formate antiporter-like MFS transporter